MCFSASASFIVGGSLVALGAVTAKRVEKRAELPFAAIPLLFGAQQIIEGVLWLSANYDAVLLQSITTYMYTMFSHVLWPIYMPFAVGLMEPELWRKKAIWVFQFAGIVVGFHMLVLITTQPLSAVVDEHIIYVSTHFYEWPMMALYVAATCVGAFFSSYKLVRLFGVLTLLLLIVAHWFYTVAVFSVWCFFAAILSLIIHFQFNRAKLTR
jgi:hypothetical protein